MLLETSQTLSAINLQVYTKKGLPWPNSDDPTNQTFVPMSTFQDTIQGDGSHKYLKGFRIYKKSFWVKGCDTYVAWNPTMKAQFLALQKQLTTEREAKEAELVEKKYQRFEARVLKAAAIAKAKAEAQARAKAIEAVVAKAEAEYAEKLSQARAKAEAEYDAALEIADAPTQLPSQIPATDPSLLGI